MIKFIMLIYFLGGKSEFSDSFFAYDFEQNSEFRFFKKIGSFVKALKTQRPGLIVAQYGFLGGRFSLKSFLIEHASGVPIVFFNKNGLADDSLLYAIKARNKIPDKLFELLRLLYNSQQSQSLAQIRARLFSAGIEWTANCARVSLCRLKKILQAQEERRLDLIKDCNGYRLLLPDQFVQVGI